MENEDRNARLRSDLAESLKKELPALITSSGRLNDLVENTIKYLQQQKDNYEGLLQSGVAYAKDFYEKQ